MLVHGQHFLLKLALVQIVNAHVFICFTIELRVLLLENVTLDSKLIDVVPKRIVLFFGLDEGGYDFL
jgi:hypothetical protein